MKVKKKKEKQTRTGLELLMSLTFSLLVSPFGMENKKKEEDIKQSTNGLVIVRKRDFEQVLPIIPLQCQKITNQNSIGKNSEMRDPLKYRSGTWASVSWHSHKNLNQILIHFCVSSSCKCPPSIKIYIHVYLMTLIEFDRNELG